MADKKITQLPTNAAAPTDATIFIGDDEQTYGYTGAQLKEFLFNGLPYDSGSFIRFKASGNTLPIDEAGDWRAGINTDGNFAIDYYTGSTWKSKQTYNKG